MLGTENAKRDCIVDIFVRVNCFLNLRKIAVFHLEDRVK